MLTGRTHSRAGGPSAHRLPGAFDLDAEDDLDADLDHEPVAPRAPRRRTAGRRRTAVVVLAGTAALVAVVVAGSELLRSPQERLEERLADALDDAGVRLAEPVSLEPNGEEGGLWWGRLRVVDEEGTTSGARVALRLDDGSGDATGELFPRVDCDTRYPLSYTGDSENSYRTTARDLSECYSEPAAGGVLVTVAWNGRDDDADGRDRQSWHTDGDGGLVWLQNGSSRSAGSEGTDGTGDRPDQGLTGEQQRAVATAEGLLDPL